LALTLCRSRVSAFVVITFRLSWAGFAAGALIVMLSVM
jgi:hypothetical protein